MTDAEASHDLISTTKESVERDFAYTFLIIQHESDATHQFWYSIPHTIAKQFITALIHTARASVRSQKCWISSSSRHRLWRWWKEYYFQKFLENRTHAQTVGTRLSFFSPTLITAWARDYYYGLIILSSLIRQLAWKVFHDCRFGPGDYYRSGCGRWST